MVDPREDTVDIAIVGGGIAGLAAAAALADSGCSVAVLEARELPRLPTLEGAAPADYDARVSALTPRSIDFLQALGAWPAIEAARSCPYRHMTVWDAEGTGRIEFDAQEVSAPSLGSIVENRIITAALAQRVRSLGGLRVMAPARLATIERSPGPDTGDEARRSLLTLEDGTRLRCGLLIAADGALSPTRQMLGMPTREWEYGHRAIVTTVAFEKGHQDTAWQRFLQSGPLALLPLDSPEDRLCSIVWSIEEHLADDIIALDDEAFGEALGQASEHVLGKVTACAARKAFPLRQRHAVDYVLPGVALVGDAAHTIHPLAGQGINLGLADVQVLAEELNTALGRGLDPGREDVLARYQRRRKGDNLAMMAAMDGFKRLFEQDTPPLRWLRNTGMRAVAAMPRVKRQIIRQAMGVS
ncbi:UbiH/UbiF/VisC/COQ6 family ubiquinone biosynthesis hydroxylase [Congregibacter litoralis]|uniref:Ubiquinone biosynthesis hydroxylase, UbiH/UbiF/VisC/COQ6 family n=1 Tax=Congregibacter litoralis KT71 TaxID=314285 RepID=A4ABX6_9GAMM|nr:UbiH/UbiF/VisC/COQ6 family ubiquinone biosynthesis hydroxylase [Congregibacter litoralis]EAQ96426.1 Ubiquinone biosynthesis hydroxylase, UbiH/UbiF/VisC/COQ6 family [Congregibacter litoralis KT71]